MNSKQMSVPKTKKQWILFLTGFTALLIGAGILLFFGIRKAYRLQQKHLLLRENPVVEITALNIKAPVLEGTDQQTIAKAARHFIGTGDFGKGNYCIAAHSSPLYKEYFNALRDVKTGMTITLYDKQKNRYAYTVSDSFYVRPDQTEVLSDFGDDRITLITCNDDGTKRLVVTGIHCTGQTSNSGCFCNTEITS